MARQSYVVKSVKETLAVLNCFRLDRPTLTLMEIVAERDGNKGTDYRFVSTLVELGYLEMDDSDRRYRLGPRILELGQIALASVNLRQKALPFLRALFAQVNEHVNLTILDHGEVLFLERLRSSYILNTDITVGTKLPVHVTSQGKVLAAHLDEVDQERLLRQMDFRRYTDKTIVDREQFREELRQVRIQGYALMDEELEAGLISMATPIWFWDGTVKAALNVAGPTARLAKAYMLEQVRPLLIDTAQKISASLGGRRRPDTSYQEQARTTVP